MRVDENFYKAAALGAPQAAHLPYVSQERVVAEFIVDARLKAAMAIGQATEAEYVRITELPDIKNQLAETEKWAPLVLELEQQFK